MRGSTISLLIILSIGTTLGADPNVVVATNHIRSGNLVRGAQAFLNAIAWSKTHAGKNLSVKLRRDQLPPFHEHGRKQLAKMLADRPAMLDGRDHFTPIREWAIHAYGGGLTGFPIDWDSTAPTIVGAEAEHSPPSLGQNASIRIAEKRPIGEGRSRDLTSEELWHHLVFEFFNACETGARYNIDRKAINGDIDRTTFIEEMFRTEHRAIQMTHLFYAEVFLPCASAAQFTSKPSSWFAVDAGWWADSSVKLSTYPRSGYPWTDFGSEYDRQTNWQISKGVK